MITAVEAEVGKIYYVLISEEYRLCLKKEQNSIMYPGCIQITWLKISSGKVISFSYDEKPDRNQKAFEEIKYV